MENKNSLFLNEILDDQIINGEITKWEKYCIHVVMISPYPGWEEHILIVSWDALRYYGDFRSEKGVNRAKIALVTCYKKAQMVCSNLEKLSRVYRTFKQELHEVDKILDPDIRQRIKSKLEDCFFDNSVFSRITTDLYASQSDREKTFEILNNFSIEQGNLYNIGSIKRNI